ncbi:hypothetical protein GCM10027271_20420 [Saccharopolyspora gloriosae]|uniref:Uncharacterized protein (DUF305 family) n=1 Tax=Saccharopolyspora gloriosae TaxID=455344 RepID=A0A840NE30_9PSEU|nr:uncharacterized protein (DUF305 family) [Saccharopolyspora gloriosae]
MQRASFHRHRPTRTAPPGRAWSPSRYAPGGPTTAGPGVSPARGRARAPRLLVGAALACGLALTGCGPAEQPAPPPAADSSEPPGADAPETEEQEDAAHTSTDQEFARQLLAHHQQLLELTELAADSGDPEVAAYAAGIQRDRQAQADELTRWLTDTEDVPSGSAPEDLVAGESRVPGMPSAELVDRLRQARGPEFTGPFKEAMAGLYDGGEQLAQAELEEGSATQMRSLAERILDGRDVERADLTAL